MSKQSQHKLRSWRRERGLTQAEAATMMGATRQQWWRWENGVEMPGPAYMAELYREGVASPNDFYDLPDLQPGRIAA